MELEAELRAASQALIEANINLVAIVDANVKRAESAEAELATLRSDNERLGRERDEREIEHRAQIADMSERFRAVNIERVIEQYGQDIFELVARVAAATVERDTLIAQVEKMRGDEATADRLLSALWRYGNLHTVKGVIYPETGSHADTLKAADDYLYQKAIARAALTKEPS